MSNEHVHHLSAETLAHLQGWQGRTEHTDDVITSAPLRALSATLDRDDPPPSADTELPPLWHWLFFLPNTPANQIGPDGHALRGGFLPPVPLPRRMWAGGHLEWHQALRVGDAVQRTSTVQSVQHKRGRSGDLVFVKVLHALHSARGLCLSEIHDVVYRPAASPQDAPLQPLMGSELAMPDQPLWQRDVVPDAVLLFRYSALTFNGHRIHYDRSYATQVEGYPGLVVHGPLMATLLVDLVRRHSTRSLKNFRFKALRPVFECADARPLRLCAQALNEHQLQLWVQDHEGLVCMQASAEFN